jgi:hypothetical protein
MACGVARGLRLGGGDEADAAKEGTRCDWRLRSGGGDEVGTTWRAHDVTRD